MSPGPPAWWQRAMDAFPDTSHVIVAGFMLSAWQLAKDLLDPAYHCCSTSTTAWPSRQTLPEISKLPEPHR